MRGSVGNQSTEWQGFSKRIRRLIADALQLCSRKDHFSEKEYQSRNRRLDSRLEDLVFGQSTEDADVKSLTERLARCMDGLLTFLDHPEVSATNNHAEREIRPAVITRENSLQNRSQKGAQCQAVFMSIYRTLKLRGLDPIDTMVMALKENVLISNSLRPNLSAYFGQCVINSR